MTKILTTQNAQITTAAVEVKTLTISGKQVTQSVFRQLQEAELVAEDGTLNGVPWGFVNYHPDKCEKDSIRHLHVIWQRGSDLLRSHVDLTPTFDRRDSADRVFYSESADVFMSCCVREMLHGRAVPYFNGQPVNRRTNGVGRSEPTQGRTNVIRGVPTYLEMSSAAYKAVCEADGIDARRAGAIREAEKEGKERAANPDAKVGTWQREALADCEKALAAAMVALDEWWLSGEDSPLVDLYRVFDAEVKQEAERRQRHRDTMAAIAELPHLFIAV